MMFVFDGQLRANVLCGFCICGVETGGAFAGRTYQ
jgi:hypothetical protein